MHLQDEERPTDLDESTVEKSIAFDSLGIQSEGLLRNIANQGFEHPTQIQSEVIPLALEGRDVSGLSRTGTGKTCAFLIPLIDRLLAMPEESLALCLAPTRELALQIETEAKKLCKDLPIRAVSTVGGMPVQEQVREIRSGARIILGTPGRVMDLMRSRAIDPANIQILVFDEADRMFDMGFIDDMRVILEKVNPQRQILLFSATMNFTVLNMMYEHKCDPIEINVSKDQITAEGIDQIIYHVGAEEKPAYLVKFCKEVEEGGIIVFVNYREKVHWVADLLQANGIEATGISSLLRQDKRNKIIASFRKGTFRALVATDVASRGIDVDGVALVVNYQLPDEAANYVHRIGRTARAGKSGKAVSIAGPEDGYNQLRIEEFIGNKIPTGWLELSEADRDIRKPGRGGFRVQREDSGERRDSRRNDRPRGPREPREPRERQESLREAEREDSMNRQDEYQRESHVDRPNHGDDRVLRDERMGRDERSDRGERSARDNRAGRDDRGERGGRDGRRGRRGGRNRGGRGGRGGRDGRDDRDFRSNSNAPQEGEQPRSPSVPYPITGNPTIYCTRTGKVKGNPVNVPQDAGLESEKRVNFLQKIGSTVSSIFKK